MSSKMDSRQFAAQKRRRRQWLTFVRMCRYGVNNFSRNAWLTIAATLVMTVTLLIIFVTGAASKILNDSVNEMTRKIDMSLYIENDTDPKVIESIQSSLAKINNVSAVAIITPEEARQILIDSNKSDPSTLDALKEAKNKLPWTLRATLKDINNTSDLLSFTENNAEYKANEDRKPSFVTRRETINRLASWAIFAQNIGIGASIVFVALSSLIIFNTIRMAIFSRKDEIEMMKLIGADRSFIRGPFVVEAIVYGFIAAIFATGIGYMLLLFAAPGLISFKVVVQPTIDIATIYIGVVLLTMIVLGAIIGVVSSLLATRRYLKI